MKKLIKNLLCFLVFFLYLGIPMKANARDAEGNVVVIVDPGHGGYDGGASANGIVEKEANWNIAISLKAELETYAGVKVYLTRGYGEWNSNTGRGRFGNQLGADLFISCHNNSGSETASGLEVYGTVNPAYSGVTSSIGNKILSKAPSLGINARYYNQRPSSGDPSRDFYTAIDEAVRIGIPAMIVEHAFVSNPSDAAFLSNINNQYRMGAADGDAIAEHFGLQKRTVNDGDTLNLIRTYSAYFTGVTGTFSSSDTNVCQVSQSGLITAVSAGSCKITCKKADGSEAAVNITVPNVVQVGLAAGVNPTFAPEYANESGLNKETVMVKAIYSDGSAVQVNGAQFGAMVKGSDSWSVTCEIPITYNGFTNNLRIYPFDVGGNRNYDVKDYIPTSANKDVLLIPESFSTVPSSGEVVNPPTEAPTAAPTEAPTVPPTTAAPTEAPIEAPTTEAPTEIETTETETTVEETTEEITSTEAKTTVENTSMETTSTTKKNDTAKKSAIKTIEIIVIVVIALAVIVSSVCGFILFRNKRR